MDKPKSHIKKACNLCFSLKKRCVVVLSHQSCERCASLHKKCDFTRIDRKRGPKPKSAITPQIPVEPKIISITPQLPDEVLNSEQKLSGKCTNCRKQKKK
ncbi:16024_t:CDS:2, partial [Acaulospora morrowiae]